METKTELLTEKYDVAERFNKKGYNLIPIIEQMLDCSPQVLAESLLKVYFELTERIIASGVNDLPPDFESDLFHLRCIYTSLLSMEGGRQPMLITLNRDAFKY